MSGPGALPLLRNLTSLMSVWASTFSASSCSFPTSICSHLGLQEDKNTLYELVDFIEVIQIKVFAFYAEVSFDRFCKELLFVSVCFGDFVITEQCWIITLTLWLEKALDFAPRLVLVDLLANRVAEFFPTSLRSTLMLSFICFCN